MTIVSQTYTLPAGGPPSIFDPALAYTTILRVTLEGLGYNEGTAPDNPGNREYWHFYSGGTILFPPFDEGGPAPTDVLNRKALVIYKY